MISFLYTGEEVFIKHIEDNLKLSLTNYKHELVTDLEKCSFDFIIEFEKPYFFYTFYLNMIFSLITKKAGNYYLPVMNYDEAGSLKKIHNYDQKNDCIKLYHKNKKNDVFKLMDIPVIAIEGNFFTNQLIEKITIEPHNICNLDCSFCSRIKDSKLEMDFENLKILIKHMNKNIDLFSDMIEISLFKRNEPFINFTLTYKFAKYIKENLKIKNNINIHTNGYDLDNMKIENFKYFDSLRINDYNNDDNNLTILTKLYQKFYPHILSSIEKLGSINLQLRHPNKLMDTFDIYLFQGTPPDLSNRAGGNDVVEPSGRHCDMNMLSIEHDGRISPCCEMYLAKGEGISIGTIDNIAEAYTNMLNFDKDNEFCKVCNKRNSFKG